MTSSNTLKKLVSIGASMLLALGGSLVTAQPAQAAAITAVPVLETGTPGAHIQAGMQSLSLSVAGCTFAGTPSTSNFALTNVGGTQTIQAVTITSYLSIQLSSALLGGEHLTIVYTPGSITCGSGNTLGVVTFDDSAPVQPSISGTPTLTATDSTLTAVPASTVGSGISQYWYLCSAAKTATSATLSGAPVDGIAGCLMLFNSAGTSSPANLTTLSLTGSYFTRAGSMGNYTYPAASFAGKFVVFAQAVNSRIAYSTSVSGDIVSASTTTTTASPVPESAKPLPVWAAPILKEVPHLSKTLNTDGGKVALTDGDFSSLKSVTIGGKPVAFSTDAKGDVSIPVPAGKAGTSADLVVTFAGGSMVIQDGIKYVAPTDVASVPESTVAGFTKKSTKVSGALAASILYAAQVDHKATSIVCNGYAASQAGVALATARAQAACDYATGAYANLTKATVAVVVNKAKAKSAALGIKVYH